MQTGHLNQSRFQNRIHAKNRRSSLFPKPALSDQSKGGPHRNTNVNALLWHFHNSPLSKCARKKCHICKKETEWETKPPPRSQKGQRLARAGDYINKYHPVSTLTDAAEHTLTTFY